MSNQCGGTCSQYLSKAKGLDLGRGGMAQKPKDLFEQSGEPQQRKQTRPKEYQGQRQEIFEEWREIHWFSVYKSQVKESC
ncbi:hypothetical protein MRB53_007015 [Persea americana]|uniref:Uncharacterized protein n=1 Tax=Persea americana TaxID=3435 RepID=A0ACC2MHN8_PERAE|nr:hypothetical protein MRB53_007015 [Persea americana]